MTKYTVPDLSYDFNALEPQIDAKTMEIHHDKHHQAYVDKLNAALADFPELASKTVDELLRNIEQVPESIQQAVVNHGGGHANHSLFWDILSPTEQDCNGMIREKIEENFSTMDEFKALFTQAALTQFGSGWAWLVLNSDDSLSVISTANQDSPLMQGKTPLVGLDVWEHAYYLKYQNRRPDYVEAFFERVNWEKVNEILETAQ